MSTCKEFTLDDMLAVTAIPVSDFNPGISPWQLKPTISDNDFSPTLTHSITIGQKPAVSGGMLIPIKRGTGKAKDSESDNVAGRLHTVKVTCDVDDRDTSTDNNGLNVQDYLLSLERTPCHLLLTFRNNTKAFVLSTEDTYICNAERDGATISVSFSINNIMGIQMITA